MGSLKYSLVRMTTSRRRSVSCRKLLLLKLQMFSILIIFLESVPQKVLADHPYTFVKPLPNVDTTSSKIIQHQPSKNTYNIAPDSFHRRERSGLFLDHHQDQMAVETNLKERKVDQISERLDKLKRRRIEIKPEPVKSKTQLPPPKMKMPDFPNFP